MGSRAAERQLLGYENKLLHPTAEPIPLPLDFLRSITSNFCDEQELGRGGYGVVYKGILPCGSVVAIKKFHEGILVGDDRSFENEVSSLMDIKHQNVVQLLGYCAESKGVVMKLPKGNVIVVEAQTRMLCFEYMCNGGLDKHLSDESSGLEWDTRYKIIKGICSGLKYLHGRNIIHLDLKPQNILMDTTMVPKIADFGLSRFLSEQKSKTVTSNCRGTTGYMAPEYIDRGVISKKADIFSLGVIIIEILKGCKDDYPDYGKRIEIDSQHFTEKVLSNWRNRFKRSSKYIPLELHTKLLKQCIDIALECVHPEKEKRPNVSNIIEILNAAEESYCGQNGEDLPVDHQEEKAKESAAPADKAKEAEAKKDEGGGGDEKEEEAPPLPPPPEEVVMRVHLHCEGCACKVKKILKGFDGIEDVIADTKAHKVVVKGKKAAADPMKVVERVRKKTGCKVELLSPMPPPKEEKKEEEKKEEPEPPKPEKKEEPTVLAVALKVHMHCEACAQVIKKRILKMKGVQSVEADLKASQVTVKGVFEEAKLADYVCRRTGKHAAIVKSEPVAAENVDGGSAKDDKKAAEGGEEKKDDDKEEKKDDGEASGDRKEADKQKDDGNAGAEEKDREPGAITNMYMHYPRFNHPSGYGYAYQYAPQLFSDENPNACSVM